MPLCGPVLAAVAIFSFVQHWTEFLTPLIDLNSDHKRTVAIGLALGVGSYRTNYNYLMAISFTMTLPDEPRRLSGIAVQGWRLHTATYVAT